MAGIRGRIDRIKDDPSALFDAEVVERLCREAGHVWRERALPPLATLEAFALQIAHANTAVAHVVRLLGSGFSESAYCQARQRLPLGVVRGVFEYFTAKVRAARAPSAIGTTRAPRTDPAGLWHGRRVATIDGTGIATPDTPALRERFGTRRGEEGLGLPMMHTLAVFDAHDGLLNDLLVTPANEQDLRHAHTLHRCLAPGDVLVGDRGLCGYVHLHRLTSAGFHGVFRVSSRWKIPFPAPRSREPPTCNRHTRRGAVMLERHGPDDQTIEIVKPHNRPDHMTPEEFAQVPSKMIVRAVRFAVKCQGRRERGITLLTTLTDSAEFPARGLADLYLMRWRVETNLRHLKRTLNADRLKCETPDGVARELLMFALVYNAVCHSRAVAAAELRVEPTTLSFVDALRALRDEVTTAARHCDDLRAPATPNPKTWPDRPPRLHPRVLKRAHSAFKVMKQPRRNSIAWLENNPPKAN
jgi:hypothetical protein